jgi:hypothetical protein
MNPSSLTYLLALDRQRELLAQAESSRTPRSELRRIAGTANPRGRRRGALRRALLRAGARAAPDRT